MKPLLGKYNLVRHIINNLAHTRGFYKSRYSFTEADMLSNFLLPIAPREYERHWVWLSSLQLGKCANIALFSHLP
jgi:hypothetical protein